ncbi:TenA family transcriptional regulator [Alicyclobacillus herbarius]|uniref:TenA family transcriptional regulator n=1 Tax=Alicyclobacillus herbarius TaxID=122960 RepID=UPI000478D4DE|nr:iron-containing redox enzyme family protein [Alicyclobacillus herbarius]
MERVLERLTSYQDVEQAIDDVVTEAFFAAPFLTWLRDGRYHSYQLRHFAIQYSYYSRHFPRVLGAAISAMEPLDTWWVPLADNLWDEAGRGRPGHSHEQLYKTFLLSVDPDVALDERGIPQEPMSAVVKRAIDTFIDFFRDASPLAAMAAVGLGSEMFAGRVMQAIGEGFSHPVYNRDRKIDVRFWEIHADEHEPRHYQLCRDILVQYQEPEELREMFQVGREIALSEAKMYQGLHEEMLALKQA